MTIEARLAMVEHRQEIWHTITRYTRGIDERVTAFPARPTPSTPAATLH